MKDPIACLGAGRMGRGIAVVFTYAGHKVSLVDFKARDAAAFKTLSHEALGEVRTVLGTLADFSRLVKAAREEGLEIALDFAIQCSPDHPWIKEHPEVRGMGTTVTAAGVDSTLSGNADAVTTIVSLTGVTCAVARNRRNANRFTATSLRSCELKSPMQPVSWLPCPPRRAPFPLQQWAYDARLVDGYSGGGRAGISPASRSLQRCQLLKSGGAHCSAPVHGLSENFLYSNV